MNSSLFAANLYKQPWLLRGAVFIGGVDGAPCADALQEHLDFCDANGLLPVLPPWPLYIEHSIFTNRLVGIPGVSELIPTQDFTYLGFNNQFILTNNNFSQGAEDTEIYFADFKLTLNPVQNGSTIGFGGIAGGLVENLIVTANRVIDGGTGKPYAIDSLIDLYACVKNVEVRKCRLYNITGAYGSSKIAEFGGSCVWIRNLTGDWTDADNVTEGNLVHDNYMEHSTSDEVIAIFGVFGTCRQNVVDGNRINSYSIDGVYHNTLIACFPLYTGIGVPAVYDNEITNNQITESGGLYSVMRIGNTPDAVYQCYNNRFRGNNVTQNRSTDPTTGPEAVWFAITGGVDPNYPDPEIASSIYRCIDGTFGFAYFRDTSGNTSTDDVAINNGATVNAGFQSFQQVTSPTSLGDLFSGCQNCRFVFGGKVECAAYAFFNCRSVVGTNYRVNLIGGIVYYLNTGLDGVYGMKDTVGESFGKLVEMSGTFPATTLVGIYNNDCKISNAGYTILENTTAFGATMRVANCSTRGASASITVGASPILRSFNDWNGTLDP